MLRIILVSIGVVCGRLPQDERAATRGLNHDLRAREAVFDSDKSLAVLDHGKSLAELLLVLHPVRASPLHGLSVARHPQMVVVHDAGKTRHPSRADTFDFEDEDLLDEDPDATEFVLQTADSRSLSCDVLANLQDASGSIYQVLLPIDDTIVLGTLTTGPHGLFTLTPLDEEEIDSGVVAAAVAAGAKENLRIFDTPAVMTVEMPDDDMQGSDVFVKWKDDDEFDFASANTGVLLTEFQHDGLGTVAIMKSNSPFYLLAKRLSDTKSVALTDDEMDNEEIVGTLTELIEDVHEEISTAFDVRPANNEDEWDEDDEA